MKKHYYAFTASSKAHNVALAFNSIAERKSYMDSYGNGGGNLTYAEAMKFEEIRHFYGRTGNDWFSQLYPRNMW